MTMLLLDGYDHVDDLHRWTVRYATLGTSVVRTGTHSTQYGPGGGGIQYLALGAGERDDTIYTGFGFNSTTGGDIAIVHFASDVGATTQVSLVRMGGTRGWQIRRGAHFSVPTGGTLLAESDANEWINDSWHYVEFGAKIADSGGWAEMRQDGITRMRFDGDTRNGGTSAEIDQVGYTALTNSGNWHQDDVYILNKQGSVNNGFLGDTRCFPLYPIGNGFYAVLVGSDGNSIDNYLLVDEAGTIVTTDYVGSSTVGDKDTYEMADLTVTLGTIRAIEARIVAAKDDTGTKQVRIIGRRSGTDFQGADLPLAAIPLYQTHYQIFELDPVAAAAWTISTVNATEWGAEVRA